MVFPHQFLEYREHPADAGRPGRRFQPIQAQPQPDPSFPSTIPPPGTPMARAGHSSRAMSFRRAASILPHSSSSSCSTPQLRTANSRTITHSSHPQGTITTALTCAAISTSHRSRSLASASAMAWKRTPLRDSRRRAGQSAAISSPSTTSTWAPTPGPPLPRSSTWPRLAGPTSTTLSACTRRV